MPTYNNNIPQPGDDPSQSQNQLLENFQVLDTAFKVDHGAYNSGTQGQHNQITFPVGPLTGQPFTFLSGQIGLQNLNQSPTSRPDIWMSRGTGTAFPITGYSVGTGGTCGWSYLPSGCLMAWGVGTITSGGSVTITYASDQTSGGAGTTFPGFNTVGNPLPIWFDAGASVVSMAVSSYNQAGFTTYSSTGANGTFIWTAIGF